MEKIPGKIASLVESTAVYKWGKEKRAAIGSKQDDVVNKLHSYVPAELLGKVPPECLRRRISITVPDLRLTKLEKEQLKEEFERISEDGVSSMFLLSNYLFCLVAL